MDQEKIGGFITACRKEAGYTQAALAEQLGISDRAVSKWERGKNMPDVSIMLTLCDLLHINVNELLTGERISMEDYQKKAEENLLAMRDQEEMNNRKLLALEGVITITSLAAFLMMTFAACFAVQSKVWQVALIATGVLVYSVGVVWSLRLEHDAGYYECPYCHQRYVPAMKTIVFAPHIGRSRSMKCPNCGQRGYHRKVLTR